MSILNFTFREAKKSFLDTAKIRAVLDEKSRGAFARIGGAIRKIAQRSMRSAGKKGKTSEAGEPPRYHNKRLRAGIAFAFDVSALQLFVGPLLAPSSRGRVDRVNDGKPKTIPAVLEFGGSMQARKGDLFVFQTNRGKKSQTTQYARAKGGEISKVEARPYMAPALDKARQDGKLQNAWTAAAAI